MSANLLYSAKASSFFSVCCNSVLAKGERKCIAVCARSRRHCYGSLPAIWDHTELPVTWQRQHSRPNSSRDWPVLDLFTSL